jgi:hypothetical protein
MNYCFIKLFTEEGLHLIVDFRYLFSILWFVAAVEILMGSVEHAWLLSLIAFLYNNSIRPGISHRTTPFFVHYLSFSMRTIKVKSLKFISTVSWIIFHRAQNTKSKIINNKFPLIEIKVAMGWLCSLLFHIRLRTFSFVCRVSMPRHKKYINCMKRKFERNHRQWRAVVCLMRFCCKTYLAPFIASFNL